MVAKWFCNSLIPYTFFSWHSTLRKCSLFCSCVLVIIKSVWTLGILFLYSGLYAIVIFILILKLFLVWLMKTLQANFCVFCHAFIIPWAVLYFLAQQDVLDSYYTWLSFSTGFSHFSKDSYIVLVFFFFLFQNICLETIIWVIGVFRLLECYCL